MPGLVRRVLIYATVNGLIVEGHGPAEHKTSIKFNYRTGRIDPVSHDEVVHGSKHETLESHGLVGLLSIASSAFLIAITRREQVAQIFGKPVYVITDVTFLPLASQNAASEAIKASPESRRSDGSASDSEVDDSDVENESQPAQTISASLSPADHEDPPQPKSTSSTSVAQDVYAKRGQFGKFASQWFSKRGWSTQATGDPEATKKEPTDVDSAYGNATAAAVDSKLVTDDANVKAQTASSTSAGPASIEVMIPKILKSSRMILCSRSFFFSYDFNLFHRLGSDKELTEPPVESKLNPLYFWNSALGRPLLHAHQDTFLMPIMQGFVGQRSFMVRKSDATDSKSASTVPIESCEHHEVSSTAGAQTQEEINETADTSQPYLLTLISRRSTKRSGLRYLRRGIDDEGNCANTVETEQILSAPDWSYDRPVRAYVQLRGSIPIFFSQSPYAFKPVPQMHQSLSVNDIAFKRHFSDLKNTYGDIQIDLLVDKHGNEVAIGKAYEDAYRRLKESDTSISSGIDFEWFDFHSECRGMKFENVSRLVDKFTTNLERHGETVMVNGKITSSQHGVIRTNCMDCLDRTNVVESALGQYMLSAGLTKEGFEIDLVADQSTTWFNTLWADNGDAISRQYAGTAALKGDFTRTRKRGMQGAMFDFSLTLTRYYNNMVNDYFSQAVIDVLLGNLSWRAFDDFENNMMSSDPGISISKVRDSAIETCRRLVIQEETEDIVHGWTALAPAHENTIRTLPFQEVVLLLTDAALYCCRFDWNTEKVASFEKVDLLSISKIRYGVYITSTLAEQQMHEDMNTGLVVVYKSGKDSIIRTNTRSLQNFVEPEVQSEDRVDGGTGILSWLAPRAPASSRVVALKVIPQMSDVDELRKDSAKMPLAVALEICHEIERAISGPQREGATGVNELVEQGDIISLAEAKKRTGYLEQIGHSIKRLVWT